MKKHNTPLPRIRLVSLFFAALVFSACATIPKNIPAPDEDDFYRLPSGGKMYLRVDINEARPLLDALSLEGFSLKEAGSVLDRTETASAVFLGEDSRDRFFLSLRGNYPTFRAGLSLAFNKGWKKLKSSTGNRYWYSSYYKIGMALGSRMALVSQGDPFEILPATVRTIPPRGFDEFQKQTILAGWIPEPQDTVNRFLKNTGIPIQIPAEDFFFGVVPAADSSDSSNEKSAEEMWELVFQVRTPSVNQARALVTLFSLARIFMVSAPLPGTSILVEENDIMDFLPALFANLPVRDEEILTLRTSGFDIDTLALLFRAFSVYSGQGLL